MGKVEFNMEMVPNKPVTKYVTYYVKPEGKIFTYYQGPASMDIRVENMDVAGAKSSVWAYKENQKVLPKYVKVTVEWDDNERLETNHTEDVK